MFKKLLLAGLITGAVILGSVTHVFARGDTITNIPIDKLDELTGAVSGGNDFVPVYDASAKKDKKIDVARIDFSSTGGFKIGTDVYTLSAAEIGTGTVTLANFTTYVISDATGASVDYVYIPDGGTAGQQKRIVLAVDGETSGTKVTPDNYVGGTDVILADVGDAVTFEWSGSTWILVSNIGGTIE